MIYSIRSQQFERAMADIKLSRKNGPYMELVPNASLVKLESRLKKKGRWTPETFRADFLPAYMEQLKTKPCRDALNDLYGKAKSGKVVAVANSTSGKDNDWSSVIVGLMQGAGIPVEPGVDMAEFFAMYKSK